MITGICIENFKGVHERVKLDVQPITLLFGPNSAGKSSILHALRDGREIFERWNRDAVLIGDSATGCRRG
jgi:predicted ATPase